MKNHVSGQPLMNDVHAGHAVSAGRPILPISAICTVNAILSIHARLAVCPIFVSA
jgi:hypothetical protein